MPTGSTHIFDEEGVAEIEGIPLPAHFKAVYVEQTGGDSPLPPWQATSSYEFEIDVVDGRPVVAQFIARRPDPDLRELPYQEVLEHVVGAAAHITGARAGDMDGLISDEDAEALRAGMSGYRRRRLTDSLLHQVANVARANPDQPTKQVAAQLYTSHRNATRWIAAAKKRFPELMNGEED